MARYKLTKNGVTQTDTGAGIPDDNGNRDWQEYQEWLAQGNKPDPEFTLAEVRTQKLSSVRAEARRIIEAKWPQFKQQNADAGIYPATVKAQKDADIAAVILASNTAEDEALAATTIAEVQAVSPVWPVI